MLEYEDLFGKANPETFAVAIKDGVATAMQTKVNDLKCTTLCRCILPMAVALAISFL
jgi:hypothetical protein